MGIYQDLFGVIGGTIVSDEQIEATAQKMKAKLEAETARKPDEFYDYKQNEVALSKWKLEAEALLYRTSTVSHAKDRLREVQKAMQAAYVRGREEAIERAQAQKEGLRMREQAPSVGRIVHFVNGDQHLAAIITDPAYREPDPVGGVDIEWQALTVFPPNEPPFTTVAAYSDEHYSASWHWPEYV